MGDVASPVHNYAHTLVSHAAAHGGVRPWSVVARDRLTNATCPEKIPSLSFLGRSRRVGEFSSQNVLPGYLPVKRSTYSASPVGLHPSCTNDHYYNLTSATPGCTACTAGHIVAPSKTECVACTSGTFDHDGNSTTACMPCSTGTFSRLAAKTCTPCAQDTFADTPGTKHCVACPRGKHTPGRGTKTQAECTTCPRGEHKCEWHMRGY